VAKKWIIQSSSGRLRLGRTGDADRLFRRRASALHAFCVEASPERPVLVDKFLEDATEVDVDCIADVGQFKNPDDGTIVIGALLEHIEFAARSFRDAAMVLPPHTLSKKVIDDSRPHARHGARVESHRPDERAICGEGRKGLCARSESRASRTVPFVSKALVFRWPKLAAKVMPEKP